MRTNQFMGLSPSAVAFLGINEIPEKICECCKRPLPRNLEIISHYHGMFDDKFNLYRHQLINGNHADEFLQTIPWSSGPVHFLGLRLADGSEFKWYPSQIEELSS